MTHNLPVLKSSVLPPYSWKSKIFPHSMCHVFLDQFISTFSGENHSLNFQDLKISTKHSLQTVWRCTVHRSAWKRPHFWVPLSLALFRAHHAHLVFTSPLPVDGAAWHPGPLSCRASLLRLHQEHQFQSRVPGNDLTNSGSTSSRVAPRPGWNQRINRFWR